MHQHYAHLFPTPEGITLAGVVIIKRRKDGTFDIEGHERHIHAMIQAAHGRPFSPRIIDGIKRGCKWFAKLSDEELRNAAFPFFPSPYAKLHSMHDVPIIAKGLMEFALTGCNDMPELVESKARLVKVQRAPEPDPLMKSYGLPAWEELTKDDGDDSDDDDSEDDDSDSGSDSSEGGGNSGGGNGHYNPDEPRIPAGQPGGGQWTTAGNGTTSDSGSISADDVRNDPADTVTQVGSITPAAYTTTQVVPVGDDDTQEQIDEIKSGIETEGHGTFEPVSSNPDANGNFLNQVNIYIGGLMDQSYGHIVQNSNAIKSSLGSNYYFNNGQQSDIDAFIDALPDDTVINVIGHSWGGDTAARVALDNPGVIDTLITVDPVTTVHSNPDFNALENSVDNWINIYAKPPEGSTLTLGDKVGLARQMGYGT